MGFRVMVLSRHAGQSRSSEGTGHRQLSHCEIEDPLFGASDDFGHALGHRAICQISPQPPAGNIFSSVASGSRV
jgi:hypothetical protein